MKKKIVDLESRFWSGSEVHSGVKLLETFFQFNDLVTTREMLNKIMISAIKKKPVPPQDAAAVFHFYLALRSFVRACFLISWKRNQWASGASPENDSLIKTGNLSVEEYRDPVRVFRKAFKAYRRKEYEAFLSSVVYFSLSDSGCKEEQKMVGPYIYLVKMLEAAYVIVERRVELGKERWLG
ncbi:hypothetical protein [uncultured Chryseobacterium sp.]|uniref:hypothetical protein n=1 Tax=uncultured Chryseobacterium sp. TaxID=259322 RepID=UPI0025EA3134|nr:hypothetical protein [uncultured Chryseobacterium sp.]